MSGLVCLILLFSLAVPRLRAQEQADSTDEQEAMDDAEEVVQPWNLSTRAGYSSRSVRDGVELSGDEPIFGCGASLSHASGWNSAIGVSSMTGTNSGLLSWYASLGYDWAISDLVAFSAEYEYTRYRNDSLNIVANLGNAFTLGISLDTDILSLGLSYDHYFGDGSADYLSFDVSAFFSSGDLTILPMLNISYGSQTIDTKRFAAVKRMQRPAGKTVTRTISGITGITVDVNCSYDLGAGFGLSVSPAFVYSPKIETSSRDTQFLLSAGVRYSVDF